MPCFNTCGAVTCKKLLGQSIVGECDERLDAFAELKKLHRMYPGLNPLWVPMDKIFHPRLPGATPLRKPVLHLLVGDLSFLSGSIGGVLSQLAILKGETFLQGLDAGLIGLLPSSEVVSPLLSLEVVLPLRGSHLTDQGVVLSEQVSFHSLQSRDALVQAGVLKRELLDGIDVWEALEVSVDKFPGCCPAARLIYHGAAEGGSRCRP